VLVQMAARLRQAFREGDSLVRWGGEEFLVLTRDTSRERAAELAQRVCDVMSGQPFVLDGGQTLHCSCSVGFAAFPLAPAWPQALEWSAVLNLADAALYAVKHQGRNGWAGLLRARAASAAELQNAARQPLALWQTRDALDWVASSRASSSALSASPAGHG